MRIAVTGGNGFIGSVVARRLASDGHELVCLLRATSKVDRLRGVPYERIDGDVRDDAAVLRTMHGCDGTVHLAAPGGWDGDDSSRLDEVIVGGARNVIAAAEALGGQRVVLVSTTAAVAASATPRLFDETSEFNLRGASLAYAHAKHRAELLAKDAAQRAVPVVIVNPGEVYGPGDTALGTAGNLVDFARSGLVVVCDGGTSIVHVDDVAAGIVAALACGRAGERYILAGENVTIRRLAELVIESVGKRTSIVQVPRILIRVIAGIGIGLHLPLPFNPHVIPYATRYWFVDNSKARRELGVTFRDARTTIESTLEWLSASGRLWESRPLRA
jgi:dihydroflavonol-4-reductase